MKLALFIILTSLAMASGLPKGCIKNPTMETLREVHGLSPFEKIDLLCESIKPGKSVVYNRSKRFVFINLFHAYRLKRHEDNPKLYTVYFNPRFYFYRHVGDYALPVGSTSEDYKILNKKFRAKINQCFVTVDDRLKGPDQMKLRLRLENEGEYFTDYTRSAFGSKAPPININVHISLTSPRQNSSNLNFAGSCSSFIHEFLHWAGLADLYREREKSVVRSYGKNSTFPNETKTVTKFGCRSEAHRAGIMNSHAKAYLKGNYTYNLISSAEFVNIIAGPDCPYSRLYQQCINNAYRTDTDLSLVGDGCYQVPKECHFLDTWLDVKF